MAVEARRGCGYRKVGGLYLVCEGVGMPCGRLPLKLHICPACGAGVKQTRGWTWINPARLFADTKCVSMRCRSCPLRKLGELERAGLLWVGKAFYSTPAHFDLEARSSGICRRIRSVPRGFKVGEDWVFLAHPEVLPDVDDDGEQVLVPAVFKVFKPTRIEKIVTESQARDHEAMTKLRKRSITPVAVPDDDRDHMGTVYDKAA